MPVSAETVIEKLMPRALDDAELAPKLKEHRLNEDDIREVLIAHANEFPLSVMRAQEDWDSAVAAVEQAKRRLTTYRQPSLLRRARRNLIREGVSSDPSKGQHPEPTRSQLEALLAEAEGEGSNKEKDWWEAAYTNWVRPQVITLINDYEDPSFHSTLPEVPGSGLAEVFHPEYEVQTAVSTKLSSLFTNMPGGSIGLSGLRGAGKTTLISSICRTRTEASQGGPSVGFVVSAPVRYEPREFVLQKLNCQDF